MKKVTKDIPLPTTEEETPKRSIPNFIIKNRKVYAYLTKEETDAIEAMAKLSRKIQIVKQEAFWKIKRRTIRKEKIKAKRKMEKELSKKPSTKKK